MVSYTLSLLDSLVKVKSHDCHTAHTWSPPGSSLCPVFSTLLSAWVFAGAVTAPDGGRGLGRALAWVCLLANVALRPGVDAPGHLALRSHRHTVYP